MRDPLSKIMDLDAAVAWRQTLRAAGRRLVVTNGCFDLMHRGHMAYLAQARMQGDALLVAINADSSIRAIKGPKRPIIPEPDRLYQLASLEAVDAVTVFATPDAIPVLQAVHPDVYVKGGDYTLDSINQDERRLLERQGCQIVFMAHVPGYSTTDVVARILAE